MRGCAGECVRGHRSCPEYLRAFHVRRTKPGLSTQPKNQVHEDITSVRWDMPTRSALASLIFIFTFSIFSSASASSVNANEIAFFSKLSEHWWDESGELGLLHRMNPMRVGFIRQKVEETMLDDARTEEEGVRRVRGLGPKLLSGLDVLDVGCGGGLLSEVSILYGFL